MDNDFFEKGLAKRKGTLGAEYVEKNLAAADDFTRPFGEIVPGARFLGDLEKTAEWLEEFRDKWDNDVELFMPEFGKPIAIYAQPIPAFESDSEPAS